MKKSSWLFAMIAFLCLVFAVIFTNHSSDISISSVMVNDNDCQRLKDIKKRGYLKVGVKVDVPRFGFLNPQTNQNEGFEPDLARSIAFKVLGNENSIRFRPITPKTRGPLLDNDDLDFVVATFTITEKRKNSYRFTVPYYTDYITFMVNKDSNFNSIHGLTGKVIGVSQSTPTKAHLQKKAEELGIEFIFAEYTSYHELSTALATKRVDAISGDRSILMGYKDENNIILNDAISKQEYAVTCKLENSEFCEYLNILINDMKTNCKLKNLIQKWNLE